MGVVPESVDAVESVDPHIGFEGSFVQVSLQTGSPLQASKPPVDSEVDDVESVELVDPHIGSEGFFVQVSLQVVSPLHASKLPDDVEVVLLAVLQISCLGSFSQESV